MKDGPIRRSVKWVARVRYMTDLKVTRWIRGIKEPPRYRLGGACNGCGLCCETPTIPVHPLLFRLKSYRWLFLTWHRVINGFELIRDDWKTKTFVFRCTHFDAESRRCDSYASRPAMCRDYPRNLLDSPFPEFLKGCSFYPVDTNAADFREALKDLDLPPAKKEELERRLHLRD